MTQRPLEDIANSLIGKPWALDGDGPHAFNCWNLIRYVYAAGRGVVVAPVPCAVNSGLAYAHAFRDGLRSIGHDFEIVAGRLDPYDIVLFGRTWGALHCGLVVSSRRRDVLHSHCRSGVVVEPLESLGLRIYPNATAYRLRQQAVECAQ